MRERSGGQKARHGPLPTRGGTKGSAVIPRRWWATLRFCPPYKTIVSRLPRLGVALGGIAGGEFEKLADQSGRDDRDGIDAQDRRRRRAGYLVSEPHQTFIAATAEEYAENRDLAEHIVEAEERNERSAQPHVLFRIIDVSVGGRSNHGTFHDALADGEATGGAGELDPHARELDAATGRVVRRSLRRRGAGGDPIEALLAAHREVANVQDAVLRRQ